MSNNRNILLILAIVLIAAAIFFLETKKPEKFVAEQETAGIKTSASTMKKEEKAKQFQAAKEIASPFGYVNTDKITVEELIGKKVILVDFWTYSCINCQRTTPYLNAWYEKYKDKGLEIIGVHTPEFEFEKEYGNVVAAVKKFGVKYPVVLDNDYATWRAYRNRYWPRKYLIDIDGFIVFDHIGEGAYEETEKKIQDLLQERMILLGSGEKILEEMSKPAGVEEIDEAKILSPEIYFGAARNGFLGNGRPKTAGVQALTEPKEIKVNTLYLVGDWNFREEFAENKSQNARIIFRYRAKKVFLVASAEQEVKITVLHDGKKISNEAGSSVDKATSTAAIRESGLYRLIEDTDYGEHTLEIIAEKQGLKAFTFTFG